MSQTDYQASPTSRATRLVIGNWKMNGSLASNEALLAEVKALMAQVSVQANLAVCPPFPYLSQVGALLSGSNLSWGSQDVSAHGNGAYTGEVSASMLWEFGCSWAIVGHSERRAMHGESNELVAQKAKAAALMGLTPVFCVGETLEQRDAGLVQAVIADQLKPLLSLGEDLVARSVIAYEPVWAIGTGRTATPEQAQDVHQAIRLQLPSGAQDVPILYGGSVKPDNAESLFAMPDIDGGLIGGAALKASDFIKIATA